MSVLAASIIAISTAFHFATLFLTLLCAAANTMILAACRASKNKFTHPVGFILKSIVVLIDIAILGMGSIEIASIALWGEIVATPILLIYIFRGKLIMPKRSIARKILVLLMINRRIATWAVVSSMSSLIFFNQERIAGALFVSLEQMGVITKMILIKIIAAQCAFIFGTYFHRHLIASGQQEKVDLFAKIRKFEIQGYIILFILCIISAVPVIFAFGVMYGIEMNVVIATSVTILAVLFFFNPFAVLLQSSGRFDLITRCNCIAVGLFSTVIVFAKDTSQIVVASTGVSIIWYILIRHAARKLI